jgi:pyruvate/2-oxoglutarate dehydrogenase complex dihydrolipoamide acyltransferase (E2) component
MFESDQHEFDEGFDELGHVAPPPPLAKPVPEPVPAVASSDQGTADELRAMLKAQPSPIASASVAPAANVAVAEPIVGAAEEEDDEEEEDEFDYEAEQETPEFTDPAERQEEPLPVPPKKGLPLWLIGGLAALMAFAAFVVYTAMKPKDNAPPPGDMGPGIVAASGLRGHLNTRWDGDRKTGKLAYQLHIEPMEDRWQAGFSHVVLNPSIPLSVNMRLLDATGFALCGKDIAFHFDPQNAGVQVPMPSPVAANGKKLSAAERNAAYQAARQSAVAQMQAAEAVREQGKDVFQSQTGPDGLVTAVNVQGSLPCSPDQYKRASYWDLNTNFPTLDEQAALLDPRAAARQAKDSESGSHSAKRVSRQPQTGFIIQGDERVMEYDSVRGQLWMRGRTFQIDRRVGQVTATAWANNNTLVHYRCDQQANCALSAPGGAAVLHARLN